jgi:hypothetical protein
MDELLNRLERAVLENDDAAAASAREAIVFAFRRLTEEIDELRRLLLARTAHEAERIH